MNLRKVGKKGKYKCRTEAWEGRREGRRNDGRKKLQDIVF